MTIDDLKERDLIVLECISGSRAYGLATPSSDTDIKGVFVLPKKDFYGLNYIPQVNNESNDIVYYELGRFMELLSVNNPNILELLNTPEAFVLHKHPFMEAVPSELILSKVCKNSFGKFALSQIKKAKGLKKKIVNPIDKERKTILEFCFVNDEKGSIPVADFLFERKWKQERCGLSKVAHMKGIYGLYYNESLNFRGIYQSEDSNEVSTSSIPREEEQQCLLYFNKDGYSSYCKDYKAYWDWVEKRNESRYENTKSHGKNYDAKNMMHTFRLLQMAIEIANEQRVNVHRKERDFLLKIKAGEFEYSDLLKLANQKQDEMEVAFEKSKLPDRPNLELIRNLTYKLREKFYSSEFGS